MSTPPRHGDRLAGQPLGRARVVAEGVDDHAHLAARVADRLAGVARLERGQLLALGARACPRAGGAAALRSAGASARQAGNAARARSTAASVSSTPARGTSAMTSAVAGSTTWIIRPPPAARPGLVHEREITRLRSSSSGCQSTPSA